MGEIKKRARECFSVESLFTKTLHLVRTIFREKILENTACTHAHRRYFKTNSIRMQSGEANVSETSDASSSRNAEKCTSGSLAETATHDNGAAAAAAAPRGVTRARRR